MALTGVSFGRGGPRLFVGGGFNPLPMLVLIGIFAVVVSGALPGVLLFVLMFVGIIVAGLLIAIGIERLIVFAIASRRARKGVIPTQEEWSRRPWPRRGRTSLVQAVRRPNAAEWRERYRQGFESRKEVT